MKKYTLRIIANNEEIGEWYRNHSHYNEGDSGIDLFHDTETLVESGETKKLTFGISCEVICEEGDDTYNVSYLLMARSSIAKTNLRLAFNLGLIDSRYQQNIFTIVDNIKTTDYLVKKKTRLFQLVAPDLTPFDKVIVANEFLQPGKNRGGGYGSTGK